MSLVGRVAALAAGNDHPAWLAMSDEERSVYYRRAEEIISTVADHLAHCGRTTHDPALGKDLAAGVKLIKENDR